MKEGQFCEGCPLANGVVEANQVITRGFIFSAPNPGFDISFAESEDLSPETNRFHVAPANSGVSSRWPRDTAEEIVRRAEDCEHPVEVINRRLGGLLGARAVKRCGAFPEQKPNKLKIVARG